MVYLTIYLLIKLYFLLFNNIRFNMIIYYNLNINFSKYQYMISDILYITIRIVIIIILYLIFIINLKFYLNFLK